MVKRYRRWKTRRQIRALRRKNDQARRVNDATDIHLARRARRASETGAYCARRGVR